MEHKIVIDENTNKLMLMIGDWSGPIDISWIYKTAFEFRISLEGKPRGSISTCDVIQALMTYFEIKKMEHIEIEGISLGPYRGVNMITFDIELSWRYARKAINNIKNCIFHNQISNVGRIPSKPSKEERNRYPVYIDSPRSS